MAPIVQQGPGLSKTNALAAAGPPTAALKSPSRRRSRLRPMFAPLPDVLPAAKRGIAWLLANQLRDGSWASRPMPRIPPPRMKTPSHSDPWRLDGLGGGALLADGGRTFTTAAGLWALAIARDLLQET